MKQLEGQVTAECVNYMIRRGWRPHRNHCGQFFTEDGRRITGEKNGFPDWTFSKPSGHARALFVYVEMKSTTGTAAKHQRELHAILRHAGYTVLIVRSVAELESQMRELYAD